mgnify:CR=1 FL=1
MNMKNKKKFSYLGVKWELIFSEHTESLVMPFYGDYYIINEDKEAISDFSVELVEKTHDNIQKIFERGDDILIHNSEKPLFHDKGVKLDIGNIRYVYNLITKSVYEINYIFNEIKIYNCDVEMLARDGIRVSRDFIKVFVENAGIHSMFHCSAVVGPKGDCIVFIGEKNKGKTTISLDLIYEHGYAELSRDRVYFGIENDRKLVAYGWPTYYNLTMKTLNFFDKTRGIVPDKYANFDAETLSRIRTKKQLIADDIFITNKVKNAEVDYFVVLAKDDEEIDLKRIISKNSFSPYDTYTTEWHGMYLDRKKILSNAKKITNVLMDFDNLVVLNVDKNIDITIERLFDKIGK